MKITETSQFSFDRIKNGLLPVEQAAFSYAAKYASAARW